MKKIVLIVAVMSVLLAGCGGEKEKTYIDGMEADGFYVEGAATATPAPTLAPEERDFRGMKWGMSLSDITAIEGEGYTTVAEGVIRYKNLVVGGYPVESEYTLEGGKLATCIYYTTHTNEDTNQYITEYKGLLERYKEKYGTPKYSEQKWAEGIKIPEASKYAAALDAGVMMYRTGWEIGNTRINLVLFKDTDSKVKMGIRYQAIDINAKGDVAPVGDIDI